MVALAGVLGTLIVACGLVQAGQSGSSSPDAADTPGSQRLPVQRPHTLPAHESIDGQVIRFDGLPTDSTPAGRQTGSHQPACPPVYVEPLPPSGAVAPSVPTRVGRDLAYVDDTVYVIGRSAPSRPVDPGMVLRPGHDGIDHVIRRMWQESGEQAWSEPLRRKRVPRLPII